MATQYKIEKRFKPTGFATHSFPNNRSILVAMSFNASELNNLEFSEMNELQKRLILLDTNGQIDKTHMIKIAKYFLAELEKYKIDKSFYNTNAWSIDKKADDHVDLAFQTFHDDCNPENSCKRTTYMFSFSINADGDLQTSSVKMKSEVTELPDSDDEQACE